MAYKKSSTDTKTISPAFGAICDVFDVDATSDTAADDALAAAKGADIDTLLAAVTVAIKAESGVPDAPAAGPGPSAPAPSVVTNAVFVPVHVRSDDKEYRTPHGVVTLTARERAYCAEYGTKPEEYAANKAFRAAATGRGMSK